MIRIDDLADAFWVEVSEIGSVIGLGESESATIGSMSVPWDVAHDFAVTWMESQVRTADTETEDGLALISTEKLERLLALARNYERSSVVGCREQREAVNDYTDRIDAELNGRDDKSDVRRLEELLVDSERDFNGAIAAYHDEYAQWLYDAGVRPPVAVVKRDKRGLRRLRDEAD